jgi:hypothetical protein
LIAPVPPLTLPLPLTVTDSSIVWVNVAVTVLAASIVTAQVGVVVPAHASAPDQLVNVYPSEGSASSVTTEPSGSSAVHVAGPPQSIPGPVTRPPADTVSVSSLLDEVAETQVASAVSLLSSSTVQAGRLVAQSPVHLLNTNELPAVSTAVSVEPWTSVQVQSAPGGSPQSIWGDPLALAAMLPFPLNVSANVPVGVGGPLKLAVTSVAVPTRVRLHVVEEPLQSPPQFENAQSLAGDSVSVTEPLVKAT